ncbi:glycosyltransferase, partial [Bacillus subtilis]|uniref:glycosyltransferase n=1 Tax=Bacillus subtilis TaxID=1423 RepID=UPI00234B4F10
MRLVKKLLNKKVYYKTKKEFIYDGVTYRYLYLRTSVFQKLFPNVALILFIIFYTLIHQKQLKKFDLISAHWGHPQGYFAYWLNKCLRIPYVITLHGSDIHTIPHKNKIVKKLTLRSLG